MDRFISGIMMVLVLILILYLDLMFSEYYGGYHVSHAAFASVAVMTIFEYWNCIEETAMDHWHPEGIRRFGLAPIADMLLAFIAIFMSAGKGIEGLIIMTIVAIPVTIFVRAFSASKLKDMCHEAHKTAVHSRHVFMWITIPACMGVILLNMENGPFWLLSAIALAICSDVGGYYAGKGWKAIVGEDASKLWEAVTPKKTWAGAVGSTALCTVAVPWILVYGAGLEVPQALLISAAGAPFAIFGDLEASITKRSLDIKDFGELIPGHGGLLDRIDGHLYAMAYMLLCYLTVS